MTTKLFTGTIRASDERFLVWATDETDAGRYVTATMGEPDEIREVARPEGTIMLLDREMEPRRVVLNLAAESELKAPPAAPPA